MLVSILCVIFGLFTLPAVFYYVTVSCIVISFNLALDN